MNQRSAKKRDSVIKKLRLLEELRDDQRFYDTVMTAAFLIKSPIAYFSIIDSDKQYIKSSFGFFDAEEMRKKNFLDSHSCNKEDSICGKTLELSPNDPLIIPDTLKDERFKDNCFVKDRPFIRFYCGFPVAYSGINIGAFCVADTVPRKLSYVDFVNLHILRDQIYSTLKARDSRMKKRFRLF